VEEKEKEEEEEWEEVEAVEEEEFWGQEDEVQGFLLQPWQHVEVPAPALWSAEWVGWAQDCMERLEGRMAHLEGQEKGGAGGSGVPVLEEHKEKQWVFVETANINILLPARLQHTSSTTQVLALEEGEEGGGGGSGVPVLEVQNWDQEQQWLEETGGRSRWEKRGWVDEWEEVTVEAPPPRKKQKFEEDHWRGEYNYAEKLFDDLRIRNKGVRAAFHQVKDNMDPREACYRQNKLIKHLEEKLNKGSLVGEFSFEGYLKMGVVNIYKDLRLPVPAHCYC
jgi:hypothetical protein